MFQIFTVCEEALETLTLSFALNPNALELMISDPSFKTFLQQVLFDSLGRTIRFVANEQFFSIATKCTGKPSVITFFIHFLFDIVQNHTKELPDHSRDVFHLLCNLLRYSSNCGIPLPKHEQLLTTQIEWLRQAKVWDWKISNRC